MSGPFVRLSAPAPTLPPMADPFETMQELADSTGADITLTRAPNLPGWSATCGTVTIESPSDSPAAVLALLEAELLRRGATTT